MDDHFPYKLFLPDRTGGICLLIEAADGDIEKLSDLQITRIRQILHLDDPRSVEELVRGGEITVTLGENP